MKCRHIIIAIMASTASAHTWIEQLMMIAPNGTMVGEPGFPRGNVKRGTPGFGDPAMVNLIPGNDRTINQILSSDLMCKDTQTKQTQTDGSPRLQAAAGSNVALRYQENGHVSLPQTQAGKPENRGTVFVYGTTQPREDDTFLSIHRVWNAEGTGGDGRGVLLSTQNYDDGQCYQVNGGQISVARQKTFSHVANPLMGADLWCQQDIQIPSTAPSGQPYTLYWVWDWPTMPGTEGFPEGKQEIYTTCMDVDITISGGSGGNGGLQNKAVGNSFVKGQDLANAAVASQLADIANPTAVQGKFIPFAEASGGPSPPDNSGKSSSSSPLSQAQATTSAVPSLSPSSSSSLISSVLCANTSSQSTGFSSSVVETVTSPLGTATNPAFSPNPTQTRSFTRTRRPRPSGDPFNPQDPNNGDPNQGPGNQNGRPGFNPDNGQPEPEPSNSNVNFNTATAISPIGASTTAATITAEAASTVTLVNSIFQTVTQTKLETVYLTATQPQKRAEATKSQSPSSITISQAISTASSSTRACSRTESVYRLRARRPFIILPADVLENTSADQNNSDTGC